LLRFQKQFRLVKNALAHCLFGIAPGVVERGSLSRGKVLLGENGGHPEALLEAHSRHWHEVSHGELRADLAFSYLLLDSFRQRLHQRQTARHPTTAAIETSRQIIDRVAQPLFHLRQQPALFQCAVRLTHPQRAIQQQRLGFAHVPHHGLHRVAAQRLQRGDALMAVDNEVAVGLFDDDNGRLLTGFSQRSEQAPLARRVADPEVFQVAV
jgi:hypothetical protein